LTNSHLAGEVALNRNTVFTSLIGMAQKLEKLGLVYYDDKVHYLGDEEDGDV
jgi:DNA-binding IclR family transcriptional regulator